MQTPIPDAYWVIDGLLLAGEYPGSECTASTPGKLARIVDAGIRAFVDLTQERELRAYDTQLRDVAKKSTCDVTYCRHPIRDASVPGKREMRSILAAIKAAMLDGRPCYVHCWGGIGRTGTVIGCWLVQEDNLSADDAIARIAQLRQSIPDARRPSPENEEQRQFIRLWARTHSLAARLDAVLTFHPARSAAVAGFGYAQIEEDGTFVMARPSASAEADELLDAVNDAAWCVPFDWPRWQEEALRYVDDPALVASADLDTLIRLWTTHLRKERFCDGHLAAMASSGHLTALLDRMAGIRASLRERPA